MIRAAVGIAMLAVTLGACAAAKPAPRAVGNLSVEDLIAGGRLSGPYLEKAIREAAQYPLGSEQNPVRADMPAGQRAYLARLRCADGTPPAYARKGLLQATPFGSLVDGFEVRCRNGSPERTTIAMDMYHPGYAEQLPPQGFTLAAP